MNFNYQSIMIAVASLMIFEGCTKQAPALEKQPVEVKVMTAQNTGSVPGRSFSGTIEEQTGSALSFAIPGTVKSVAVVAGQRVAQGQLIAVLDDATFRSSLDMSAATLDQAKDAYARLKQLHDNNSLPEVQWVEVESKLRQAQSAYDISLKNLNDTKLYAPFAGYIAEKNISAGNNVMPGTPAVKLVKVDNVKVNIAVPETEISSIRLGQDITISVPALDGRTFTGRVSEKDVAANALSRSYTVKADISNPDHSLLPGMLCTLIIDNLDESASTAILVPRNVVGLDSDNRNFVWLDVDGKAVKRPVTLGEFVGTDVVLASGVNPGEQIIVEGQQKISENMNITIKK